MQLSSSFSQIYCFNGCSIIGFTIPKRTDWSQVKILQVDEYVVHIYSGKKFKECPWGVEYNELYKTAEFFRM